jgi:hypothetical protein
VLFIRYFLATVLIFGMIKKVQLNYNKDAFEYLKSSGYLRNEELQKLLNDYYSQINQIDQRNWANALELELDRSWFLYSYIELEEKVHTGLSTILGKYTIELKNHPGHKIIMRLLFRGGIGNSSLIGFYENHIKTGQKLIEILNKEIQPLK